MRRKPENRRGAERGAAASTAAGSAKSINELNIDLFDAGEDDRFSNPGDARKKAMDYLARREYGQQELIRKLSAAGYDRGLARTTVEQLTADGLQDDRRFVENFVQSRVNQGKGPVRIHADLAQRGLAEGLIGDVLEHVAEDWFALARQVREKKFGGAVPANFKEKARQMQFLQSRGFTQGHIQSAVSGADVG